jgi:hypothetical protein
MSLSPMKHCATARFLLTGFDRPSHGVPNPTCRQWNCTELRERATPISRPDIRASLAAPLQANCGSMSDSRTLSGHLSPLIAVQWLQR